MKKDFKKLTKKEKEILAREYAERDIEEWDLITIREYAEDKLTEYIKENVELFKDYYLNDDRGE